MESESSSSRNVIDELRCADIQGERMEGESGVTRSIVDELQSWDIQ